MGITTSFDASKEIAKLRKLTENVEEDIAEAFFLAAQETVNAAKLTDTYKDQTNLLRSSIGFVVYRDGVEIYKYFEATAKNPEGNKGNEGVNIGMQVAQEEAAKKEGIVAVICAGANYALAVESRGYDVITGSCQHLPEILEQKFEMIKQALTE